ncbi:MAG: M90 family metallopeptidase [Thiolinea sp.]
MQASWNPQHVYLLPVILLMVVAAIADGWPRYRLRQALAQPFLGLAAYPGPQPAGVPAHAYRPATAAQNRIQQFLHEKHFTGCAGLQVTDEMRVTIAASACLLLNRKTSVYPPEVYPGVSECLLVQREGLDEAGPEATRRRSLLGESWSNGKVILSWEDVIRGNRNFGDGHNVALHEFAHQLDAEDGTVNGAPYLGSAAGYQRWAKVLTAELEQPQRAAYQAMPRCWIITAPRNRLNFLRW